MSLRYAILGLLVRESLTGYDLTKKFDTTIGFFWSAKHSQIYPELANLTTEGLVTFELVTQTSKPNKKVYTITDAGREALCAWMNTPKDRRAVKDPLLMRAWIVGIVDPELAISQFQDALAEYEQRCEALRQVEMAARSDGAYETTPDNEWLGAALALRCGTMSAEAYRDWLIWAIEQLEKVVAARRAAAAAN
jgi:DNA-binding PadR family transcriptional regulator